MALPTGPHRDFPPGLRWIKRESLSFEGPPPTKRFGNAKLYPVYSAQLPDGSYTGIKPDELQRLRDTPLEELTLEQIARRDLPWTLYMYPHPIPDQGEWCVTKPFGFFWRTKGRLYIRFAWARWDDLAYYYERMAIAIKLY